VGRGGGGGEWGVAGGCSSITHRQRRRVPVCELQLMHALLQQQSHSKSLYLNLQAGLGGWGGQEGGRGGSRLRCWVVGRGHARLVFGFEGVGGDIAIEGDGRVAEGW
jgi:hypothetical protein